MQSAQISLSKEELIKIYIDLLFLFHYKVKHLRQRSRKGIPLATFFYLQIGDEVGQLYMRSAVSDFVAFFLADFDRPAYTGGTYE